jgi:DNA-binding NtrC family response regulator
MTTPRAPADAMTVTILFVDDEPAVTRAIGRVLSSQPGFEILTATSAAEALDVLRTRTIDVLVSDIDMPEMTGLELVRRARRDFPTTLRILLTGAGTMDRAVNAINEGEVVRFFTKPFELDRFIRALNELRESILMLRRERHTEAQRERCDELFKWIDEHYPGTLDFTRNDAGEVIIDAVRLRSYVDSAAPEVRALAGESEA